MAQKHNTSFMDVPLTGKNNAAFRSKEIGGQSEALTVVKAMITQEVMIGTPANMSVSSKRAMANG